ncbi:hypothetical protein DESUT3_05280 [Desulfuromonas versatilis]|uniref:TadE-like domain-containing protein n=1 Tax=Desulfuromonas versatilis TaxID=2802975 RepID=A0ABN6DVB9_9BACT|nr:TadE/TadG family type IV pilus assembly protein [Desulfuromonas versatilis]BCR03459.1 hypothetical protein DESUT3_05280 [Desulfuromonas versatilis]
MRRTGADKWWTGRRLTQRLLRREKGAVALEFTFAGVLFFVLFFAIIEFGLMFWVNLTMQHAVREGARYAITGLNDRDPTPAQGEDGKKIYDRDRAVTQMIRESSMGLYDKVVVERNIRAYGGSRLSGYGAPGDIIVINLDCAWPLLTPLAQPFFRKTGGRYEFTVSATMRNEAFQP